MSKITWVCVLPPYENSFATIFTNSNWWWKLLAPSLPDESSTKQISDRSLQTVMIRLDKRLMIIIVLSWPDNYTANTTFIQIHNLFRRSLPNFLLNDIASYMSNRCSTYLNVILIKKVNLVLIYSAIYLFYCIYTTIYSYISTSKSV